jgi:DNA (cytosine-5)-methyltransferase 1
MIPVAHPNGYRMTAFAEYADDETASAMKMRDYKDATDLVTHSLRGEGFDASEDGTGRGTPLVPVCFSSKDHGADALEDLSPTIRAGGHAGSHANAGVPPAIAFHPTQVPISSTDVSHAMGCGSSQGSASIAVAYGIRTANTSSNGWGVQEEVTHTLDQAQPHAIVAPVACSQGGTLYQDSEYGVAEYPTAGALRAGRIPEHQMTIQSMQVRRLTPTECERLQGFPDGYTDIPWRGKQTSPDGPRYKALGNSMAVPVMRWIGVQLSKATNDHALCL